MQMFFFTSFSSLIVFDEIKNPQFHTHILNEFNSVVFSTVFRFSEKFRFSFFSWNTSINMMIIGCFDVIIVFLSLSLADYRFVSFICDIIRAIGICQSVSQ